MGSNGTFETNEQVQWVVVNTQPHRENLALINLGRQGFTAYCPMVRATIRHARRTSMDLRPLFRGYVFAQTSVDLSQWRPILSTYGVRTLVRFGGRLSFVEHGFVQSLKSREVGGAIIKPNTAYQVGQEVRMSGGAFEGLVAKIIEMSDKDRLVLLMNMLGGPVRVKAEASHVEAF